MESIKKNWKGVLFCILIAIVSWYLGKLLPIVGGPVFAILIGMVIALFLKKRDSFQPGIQFTSKKVLQYAVILLGFGMNLNSIYLTGKQSLPIILSTIATSLILSFILYKALKMDSKISILIGVGSSICGGSAIAATAPVIHADDEEIAQSISVIFLFNILAALIFPTLGGILGLSNEGFGLFAGTAVNDTSSVTAAATAWDGIHGSNTLETATIVKLTRTLAIIPITLVLAFVQTRKAQSSEGTTVKLKSILPYFILFFVLASVITTIFNPPEAFVNLTKNLSKFMIIMAMGAIGLNTDLCKASKVRRKTNFYGSMLLDRNYLR